MQPAPNHRVHRARRRIVTVAAIAATLAPVSSVVHADPVFPPPQAAMEEPPPKDADLSTFHAVSPKRVVDSRESESLAAGATRLVDVTGVAGVPGSGVSAVVANVTVTNTSALGYLTVFPSGSRVPDVSNLNFGPGQTVPNLVSVRVGSDGRIAVFNGSSRPVDFIVDITGWFGPAAADSSSADRDGFHAVSPKRVVDSRESESLAAGAMRLVDVTGVAGVPGSGVSAVVANVTVTNTSALGYLTVFPSGSRVPDVSNLNFGPGQTVPNLVSVRVGSDGRIAVFNGSSRPVDFIVDITGWFGTGSDSTPGLFGAVSPKRVVDSRESESLAAGATRLVDVTGVAGVPGSGVLAVVANVTVTNTSALGYLTVFPSGSRVPDVSNLNFGPGQTVPNLVSVRVGSDGRIAVFNGSSRPVDFIVDITGWYSATEDAYRSAAGSDSADDVVGSIAGLDTVSVVGMGGVVDLEVEATPVDLPIDQDDALSLLERAGMSATFGDGGGAGQTQGRSATWSVQESSQSFAIGSAGYLQTAPDAAIGRLYGVDAAGDISGTCSGTVVARNLVVTAAHCITHSGYVFVPGQFGNAMDYGGWSASRTWVSPSYGGWNSGADMAFLVFDDPNSAGRYIGDVTGFFPIHSDPPGGAKYSIGYPSEGWFGTNCRTGSDNTCWPYFCSSPLGGYYQTATDASVSYGGWWVQGIGCYTTGGASGGPMFQLIGDTWYVVGVNSYIDASVTYTAGCTRESGVCWQYARNLWAPYFNIRIIEAWRSLHLA